MRDEMRYKCTLCGRTQHRVPDEVIEVPDCYRCYGSVVEVRVLVIEAEL